MAGADVLLTVGIARTASYQTIDTDLQAIQKHIEGKKLKINVGINTAVKTAWSQQIKSILNGINEKGLTVKVKKVDIGAGAISSFKRQLESVVNTIRLDKGVSLTLKAKDIGEIKKDFDDAGSAADEAARKIGAFKAQMEALGSLKKEVQAALKSLGSGGTEEERARIAEIIAQYNKWNEEIHTVKASGTAASSERRAALQAEHDAILKNISAIVEERNQQKQTAAETQAAMSQLIAQRQQVQAALEQLEAGNTPAQQEQIDKINSEYQELESRINAIKQANSEASKEELQSLKERYSGILQMISAYREAARQRKADASEEEKQQVLMRQSAKLLSTMQNAENSWTKAKTGSSRESYAAIQTYIRNLEELRQKLASGQITNEEFERSLSNIRTGFEQSATAIRAVGENTKTTISRIGSLSEKFATWFSITRVIMYAVRTIKDMVRASIELDSAFAQLKIVTGATDAEMSKFVDTTIQLAKSLGQSVSDVAKSVETFSRLGYSLPDASKLAEFATILANVAAVDINEATTGMTSIIKGYNMNVSQTEHVADVLVEVGQKYAVSAAEMMEAFEKSGAALNATNTSFEKSAGLIAAANASVQNASTVGTALKTVSARIRGSKTELEELGESVDELANGFSKYAAEIKALTGFDIMVEGTTDQFKDLYDIMEGIAGVWDRLTDTQQARVSEILGGTRQLQVISSIIGNWGDAVDAYATSMNAAGAATRANDIYMETAQAHINQFKATFQELAKNLMQSDFLKDAVDLGKFLLNIVNLLTKVINVLGGLRTVLFSVAGVIAIIKADSIVNALKNILTPLKAIITLASNIKTAASTFATLRTNAAAASAAGVEGAGVFAKMAAALNSVGISASAAQVAVGALVAVLGVALIAINAVRNAEAKRAAESKAIYDSAMNSAQESKNIYELYVAYANAKASIDDNIESKKALESATRDLADALGYERDAASAAAEELDNLTRSELEQRIKDLNAGVVEAQKLLTDAGAWETVSLDLDNAVAEVSGLSPTATGGVIGAYGWDQLANAEQAQYLVEAYDLLIQKRDAMVEAGETESASYRSLISTIQLYEEPVKNLIKIENELADAQERLNNVNSNNVLTPPDAGSEQGPRISSKFRIDFEELSNDIDKVTAAYKLLDNAQKEMEDGGGLSADTVKALAGETADYLDYLYEENGVIKLNTEAWREYIDGKLDSELARLDEERKVLEAERAEIQKRQDELAGRYSGGADPADIEIGNQLKAESEALEENTRALQENQVQRSLYAGLETPDNTGIGYDKLSEEANRIRAAYDLISTAEKEMKAGGLSADTIKALAAETSDYLDYLYEENGVIKLNTQAWKDYILTKLTEGTKESDGFSGLNELQATRDALIAEREEIQRNREELQKRWEHGGASTDLYYAIAAEDEKLAENTRLLAENGIQIGIITEQYNQAAMSVDAYSAALDGFTDIADTISSVSDALTVVADLQDAVADGFTMSLEKALEFAEAYPEILNNASVAADGQIELNEATVNSFIDGKEAEIKAQIDSKITQLQADRDVLDAKLAFARAELELAQSVGEGKGQITQEEAEYRVNAGNAVAEALIAAGIDEANAYKLACAAMAQNAQEFDRIAMNVCTDVDGNFNKAAYEAAQGIYRNMNSAKRDISSVARQAQLAAAAIRGMAAGVVAGSSAPQAGSGGGSYSNSYSMNMTAGTFNGTNYSYTPQTVSLEKFISDLELDISSYENAISQIDGQIAALQALRNKDLGSYKSSAKTGGSGSSGKSGSSGGSGKTGSGKSGSSSSSSSSASGASWFEQQYKLHNHLLNMDAEKVEDYLVWLNDAFQKAYKQNIITLDDYYKYQEEVYTKSKELFKDYLNDTEHQIYLLEQHRAQGRDIDKIIAYYRELMDAVKKESIRARRAGLTEEDDYIQELQKKYREYYDAIAEARSKWFDELLADEKFSIERMTDVGADSNKLVNAWKSIIASIKRELDWYLANGYKMTDDVVQELLKELWSARDEIISIANSVVDGIQNVYKTFTDAATEWATTGYLSVDSMQAILELGPKYLKFLYDENGQLKLNEQALQNVLAAKTEELATDTAMTYVKQVLEAAHRKDIGTLIALTDVNSTAAASSWDLVYATLAIARAIGVANGIESKYFNDALDYVNKIKSLSKTAIDSIADYYKTLDEGYISQADALDKLIDYTKQLIKWENEQQVQALRDQVDAYKEIIEAKKEALRLSKEQEEHDKSVADKIAEIAKLQARIDLLALDDSREAKAERAKLEEELAEKQKALAEEQNNYAYEQQTEALDKSLEEFENEKNAEIDVLSAMYDSEEKLYQAAIDRIQNEWGTLYDQLIAWNTEYGSELNKHITSAWNTAADAVSRYGSFLDALIGTDSHVDIGPYIDEYGDGGNTSTEEGILAKMRQNAVNWWGATDEQRSGLRRQSMVLAQQYQQLTGKSLHYENGTWYTEDGQRAFTTVTKDEIIQAIIAAMKRNGKAWGSADKETRQYLSDANLVLGARLAKILNADVHRENGTWYIGNRLLFDVYHSGGVAGNKPTLKQNEVMAVLKKGEAVLDENREKELYRVIDFVQVLSDRLGKAINPVGLSRMSGSIVGIPTVPPPVASMDGGRSFVFSPSIQVAISHSGNMSDLDARRYGNEIAEVALGKLSDAFAKRGINSIGNAMLKQ